MVYKKKTANWPGVFCRLLGHVIIYLFYRWTQFEAGGAVFT